MRKKFKKNGTSSKVLEKITKELNQVLRLIFNTANRKTGSLAVVKHAVKIGNYGAQSPTPSKRVSVRVNVLRSTPPTAEIANIGKIAIVEAITTRKTRETVTVSTIAVIIPTRCAFHLFSSDFIST